MTEKTPQNSAKSFLIIDGHFLIIVMLLASVALCIFGGAVILHLEKEIREISKQNSDSVIILTKDMERQKEKTVQLEEIVFNNDVLPNMKKIKLKDK